MQDIITVYIMNTWADVGGSDAWVRKEHMPWQLYDVWHCEHTKSDVWNPNTSWDYKGQKDWWTYGSKGQTPEDNIIAAIKKATPKAAAAKRKAKGKAKGKVAPKAKLREGKVVHKAANRLILSYLSETFCLVGPRAIPISSAAKLNTQ